MDPQNLLPEQVKTYMLAASYAYGNGLPFDPNMPSYSIENPPWHDDYVQNGGDGWVSLTPEEGVNFELIYRTEITETNQTGFSASIFQVTDANGKQELVISFAGTDQLKDAQQWSSFFEANPNTPQIQSLQDFMNDAHVNEIISNYDGNITFTGHSLGGTLAQIATYDFLQKYPEQNIDGFLVDGYSAHLLLQEIYPDYDPVAFGRHITKFIPNQVSVGWLSFEGERSSIIIADTRSLGGDEEQSSFLANMYNDTAFSFLDFDKNLFQDFLIASAVEFNISQQGAVLHRILNNVRCAHIPTHAILALDSDENSYEGDYLYYYNYDTGKIIDSKGVHPDNTDMSLSIHDKIYPKNLFNPIDYHTLQFILNSQEFLSNNNPLQLISGLIEHQVNNGGLDGNVLTEDLTGFDEIEYNQDEQQHQLAEETNPQNTFPPNNKFTPIMKR